MPILSLLCAGLSYALSAGISLSVGRITTLSLGLMFAAIGNYLPKCRRNYTIGIKVTWALASDENWNATHRFAGKVWVIGGVAVMLAALLPEGWNVFAAVLGAVVISVIPAVYSYRYYKGQLARGEKPDPLPALSSRYWKISAAVTVAILVFVAVKMCIRDRTRSADTPSTVGQTPNKTPASPPSKFSSSHCDSIAAPPKTISQRSIIAYFRRL